MSLFTRMKAFRLRTKFVLPISALLIASLLIVSAILIRRQADGFFHELETKGETMVRIMAMQAESGVLFENRYELDELLQKFSVFEDVQAALIYGGDGDLLSGIGDWQANEIRVVRGLDEADAMDRHRVFYVEDSYGREYIEFNYPVVSRIEKLDRENLGLTGGIDQTLATDFTTETIGSVKLVLSLDTVNESISTAVAAATILTIVVALLTILVLMSFVRYITRPLRMLVLVTDQVSQGDLTQRVPSDQKDEIGQLARTFNKMIESLKMSRDEIEMYNRTLEEKIIQGTLKLEEAQAQLVQSEKMSAVGQLAAGVAHELNNPLGGILGYAQFTLEKMKKAVGDGEPSKEQNTYIRYLTDIETQARRCKAIVQNLLRFSRSSRTTDFEDTECNQVLRDTITFVEHQLHMNQIGLEVDLDENLPLIQGNPGQLQQVFTNLIINAMHASPPDSKIAVSSRFSPALGEFGGTVEVAVHDHGSGISSENINKIFEPFFTTKEVGKGTGLGLSVSYGIIKDHGGEIKVDSEPGEYTTFTVILPVQKSDEPSDNDDSRLNKTLARNQ